ncbi:MAG TPA: alpha/beta hydrolase [Steroidobacteraceae bacterium]|jgi:pimeloyl-ACP methyl ester carboxylesterase|nr:alpha/beta hydrolase [Steroidobacteraceae bacterium]
MSYEPGRVPWQEDVQLRGVRHRLTWWGERTSDPIVLLHGFLDCGATWQFLVDRLPTSWTLVAPDWRGFGDSEWVPGGYWFPDYFADLDALLDTLVPQSRARVIGHSMGANVAKMYGGIRPQRMQWLANLEGLGLARTRPEEAPKRYAHWLDEVKDPFKEGRYESIEQLTSILRMRNPRLTADRAAFVARAWSRPEPDSSEVRLRFDPRHRLVNPILYRREEAEACWARLEIPMLLVMGELSDHRARQTSYVTDEQLHGLFRRLRLVTVPGTGHMMHHEDPAAVARHIVEFERDCVSSGS